MSSEKRHEFSGTEPTVLDWFKSLLRFKPIPIPKPVELMEVIDEFDLEIKPEIETEVGLVDPLHDPDVESMVDALEEPLDQLEEPVESQFLAAKNLRLPSALFLAFLAQLGLESKPSNVVLPIALYLLAGLFVGWSAWAGDFELAFPIENPGERNAGGVRLQFLGAGIFFTILTFIVSRLNEFNFFNLFLWVSALSCTMIAFWEGEPPLSRTWRWIKSIWSDRELRISITPWHVLVSASIVIIVYFRFTQLDAVPYEMWSDHAEKLWDVMDVLEGRTSIFFPRNTGREPLQFYVAAATAKYLGTGISFNTLRIGTILAGLLTLPYLYLFAKEFGGRYVGLAAVLFAGIAYWPNLISRIGLRFPLYPLFVAPAMYYLLRGIRLKSRNDFLLCGFAVGLGLLGYSPARVLPVLILIGVLIYSAVTRNKTNRINALSWLVLAGIVALVIFTPLLGAVTEMMDIYLGRMLSRFTDIEQPLPGNPVLQFFKNAWDAMKMFAWDNGEVWVVSVPYRPALDWITGGLFHLGVVIIFIRFLRQRRWQDLFLLLSIPILLLSSIMALTFPGENPALNRASGAIVPVFTIVATTWMLFMKWMNRVFRSRVTRGMAVGFALLLFYIAARSNYQLVFKDYAIPHRNNTWNTSEIGAVIRGFANTIGSYDTAHVIPYAHWVDTRLVGINAGNPKKDYGVWPQDLDRIPPEPDRPQLFVFKPEDQEAFLRLKELYPNGVLKRSSSEVQGRDFYLYYVFPSESSEVENVLPIE